MAKSVVMLDDSDYEMIAKAMSECPCTKCTKCIAESNRMDIEVGCPDCNAWYIENIVNDSEVYEFAGIVNATIQLLQERADIAGRILQYNEDAKLKHVHEKYVFDIVKLEESINNVNAGVVDYLVAHLPFINQMEKITE
jgi:hypothetical protein